jgi:hypothetical protein
MLQSWNGAGLQYIIIIVYAILCGAFVEQCEYENIWSVCGA